MMFFFLLACSSNGIMTAEGHDDIVVICGEAIVINIDKPKTDAQILADAAAMIRARKLCPEFNHDLDFNYTNPCYGELYYGTDDYFHQEWLC